MRWFRSNTTDPVKRSAGQSLKLPEITSSNISGLTNIAPAQGVFMLNTTKGEIIVLKSENYSADQGKMEGYNSANKIMSRISRIKGIALVDSETTAIENYSSNTRSFHTARSEVSAGRRIWIKANYVADEGNLEDPDTLKNFTTPVLANKRAKRVATIATICNSLESNAKAWKEFGKIDAADMFSGNPDRFNFDPPEGVQNWGNIMFTTTGGKIHAIGLDNYATDQQTIECSWREAHGKFIKDIRLGHAAIDKIFDEMKTRMESYGLTPRFTSQYLKHFKDSFTSGVSDVKHYVTGAASIGRKDGEEIKKKLDFLGWGLKRTLQEEKRNFRLH